MSTLFMKYSVITMFAFFLSWAYLYTPQTFFALNTHISDYLFNLRGDLSKSDHVVVIDIDESSLQAYGQWPWSRFRVADLINKLTEAEAGIIGLDIVFSEFDKTSPHTIAEKLKMDVNDLENYDKILAKTFLTTPTVGGYFFRFDEYTQSRTPMIPAVFIEKGLQKNNSIIEAKSVVLNIDILDENLYSSGFFNNIPDSDGMIRSVPLIMRYEGMMYPSLILEMLRIYSQAKYVEIIGDDIGVEKIRLGDFTIPTDHSGRLNINFRGGSKHFKYISAKDILEGNFNSEDIAGKFILVGTSAMALSDLRAIPLDSVIPGVEVLANVLDNILVGDFIYKPFDLVLYDLFILWFIIFFFSFFISRLNSWLILPMIIVSFFVLFKLFFYVFFSLGIIVNLLFPLLAFVGTLILTVSMDYLITSRQKEYIQRTFEKKVSKAVIDDLLQQKDNNVLEAHEEDVAIFFSDIRGFTTIAENLNSSEKLVALLNLYMTPMVEIISREEGTIDKFIGDSIMAYWNAPKHVENYADKAVISAIKQIKALEVLNKRLKQEFDITLEIGIGINVGSVTVGEMGSLDRSDYTIIGDNVNLAARVEDLNKLYGTTIIITKTTYELLKESYPIRSLDIVRVKGKHKAVEIFEVITSKRDRELDDELVYYAQALKLYRNGSMQEAHKKFKVLDNTYNHKLYSIYLERCKEYIVNPDKKIDMVHLIR